MNMEALKLIAMDEEDLAILSTYCQDAVAKIGDLQYFPVEKRFVLAMNRYVWEKERDDNALERRRSVMHFNQVSQVKLSNISRDKPDEILSLLALTFEANEGAGGNLHLIFSANATLCLKVECIEVQLSDMDAAWQAKSEPVHEIN